MKKILLFLPLFFACNIAYGQVGVNTETPSATMHVTPTKTDATTAEGIIAPNLTRAQLISKDARYTALQKGSIVYVTDLSGTTTTKTAKVTSVGYYYFDGSVWQQFVNNVPTTEPWYVQGGITQATGNAQNIFQSGNVAIGSNTSSGYKLQVTGTSNVTGNARVGGNSTVVGNEYVTGNVGVGTTSPTAKVHINTTTQGGGFRLVDGSQGTGKVLTDNGNGYGTWKVPGVAYAKLGNIPTTVTKLVLDTTHDSLHVAYSGMNITLDPGEYQINFTVWAVPYGSNVVGKGFASVFFSTSDTEIKPPTYLSPIKSVIIPGLYNLATNKDYYGSGAIPVEVNTTTTIYLWIYMSSSNWVDGSVKQIKSLNKLRGSYGPYTQLYAIPFYVE
ncbi:hypothetical protein [Dysgonomonas sp. 520]|uniref:hypothetical protein n=1 Tax=Dysgonomonas sp. 520 TaxID=2302931 RepID=UPI0013CF530A|nr:hypothetical protein [Dysgonomonas sp. 520]NDW09311.1 hypothetical protein [Dysgonomonas sp. 520]